MPNQPTPRNRAVPILGCAAIVIGLVAGGAAVWLGVSGGDDTTEVAAEPGASSIVPSTTTSEVVSTTTSEVSDTTAEDVAGDDAGSGPTEVDTEVDTETTGVPEPTGFVFPVKSEATHYDPSHHDYPAADMFAPCDTPVVAVTDGRIEEVETVDTYDSSNPDGGTKSGLMVALVDSRGVRYYGSHMSSVSVGTGDLVAAGDQIGTVGETGNAVGTGCHLHFGLSPACLTGWENRRGHIAPQPFLDAWRSGQASDPLEQVKAIPCT